jgi:hypothetical protein
MRLLTLLTTASVSTLIPGSSDAQRREMDDDRWLAQCQDRDRGWDDQFCEVRDVNYTGPSSRIVVDGHQNGGVTVVGWDQNTIRIRARVQASGRSESAARNIAGDVRILADGTIRAEGPERERRVNWSVSYVIYAPRRIDLDLRTMNGGIHLEDVEGAMRLRAMNGGLYLDGVGGDVRGETTNGGLHVTLTGASWRGQGLDVETMNGGVTLDVPARYSATLETGTVNGGFDIDFPVTLQGRFGRRVTTTLGDGGPRVRATTTNGGVRIRRSS